MDNSKKIYALLFQRCSLELPTFQHRFNSNNDTVYFTDPPLFESRGLSSLCEIRPRLIALTF